MKRALLFSSLLCVFISVSLLAQASVTLSPSSYNFGSTPVGTGTAWVTFTLANSGSSAVSISNVAVSGPFVVSSNCGSSVAANGSCPIYVYFYPTASGAASGTLTVTDSGTQTSALSGTGGSGGSCTTTPSAPTGLAASGTTSSSTNLSWNAVTPPANCTISSYTILKNGTSIGTATGTTFSVTGLAASTAYTFTVEATDSNGTSGPSSGVNVTTLANSCTTKPSAPTGLAASGTTSSGTNLSWNVDSPPTGCTISSYTVLQNGTSIGTPTGTSFSVSGLAASTTYTFTVEATDTAGTSTASAGGKRDDTGGRWWLLRNGVERHCGLHRGHDGECWRRKLRRQFLDTEPESLDQQRRSRQRRTLDRDHTLLDLLGCTGCLQLDWQHLEPLSQAQT